MQTGRARADIIPLKKGFKTKFSLKGESEHEQMKYLLIFSDVYLKFELLPQFRMRIYASIMLLAFIDGAWERNYEKKNNMHDCSKWIVVFLFMCIRSSSHFVQNNFLKNLMTMQFSERISFILRI